jgi:hypothetical protein
MQRDLMRQAQQLQAKLAKVQEELRNETIEASSGGGAVTVVVNGHNEVQSVKIDPSAVDPDDVEMLEDLVLAAINEGIEKSKELASQRMGAMTGGLKIPGLT